QRRYRRFELEVHEKDLRARVLENVADLVTGETDVDRHQDAAARGHAVVSLEHGGDVRTEKGPAVVLAPAGGAGGGGGGGGARKRKGPGVWLARGGGAERGGEAIHPFGELGVGVAPGAVDHRDLVGEHVRAALEEAHRGELGAIDLVVLHLSSGRGASSGGARPSLPSP